MKNTRLIAIVLSIAGLLAIPLVAMQFSDEVDWTLSDFVFMGILLGTVGFGFELAMRKTPNVAYRAAVVFALLGAFLLIWVNGAVGIIGDGPANVLYGFVPLVGLVGAIIAGFKAKGMVYALTAAATVQFLIPFVALLIWATDISWSPGMAGVFLLNSFFVALFALSAILFRRAR